MCGIAGFLNNNYSLEDCLILANSLKTDMYNRGPDSSGIWHDMNNNIFLIHTRLSIVDLSFNGKQPMISHDTGSVISFNGEIYNFREIKKELILKSYKFKSNTDTEVILHGYEEWGLGLFGKLRGMYAIAIWDPKEKKLLLTRDGLGIKPLYYHLGKDFFIFASQAKYIQKKIRCSLNFNSAISFLYNGSVYSDESIFQDIKLIEQGSINIIKFNDNRLEMKSIQSDKGSDFFKSCTDYKGQKFILEKLRESIDYHSFSDAKAGILLSAGVDSTAILATLKDMSNKSFESLTISAENYFGTEMDEIPIAKETAEAMDSKFNGLYLNEIDGKRSLINFLDAMDSPTTDGLNTWIATDFAKKLGWKVAYSGMGADEIFGGYNHYKFMGNLSKLKVFSKIFKSLLNIDSLRNFLKSNYKIYKISNLIAHSETNLALWSAFRSNFPIIDIAKILNKQVQFNDLNLPLFIKESIDLDQEQLGKSGIQIYEIFLYLSFRLLRDSDWCSMSNSIELRTPFADYQLYNQIISEINFNQINLQNNKKALLRFLPKNKLSNKYFKRNKTGFNIPLRKWLFETEELKYFLNKISNKYPSINKRELLMLSILEFFCYKNSIASFIL